MRIDALRLIAFGPFSGTVLDLSGGQEGFHIVYGPNEAGKSSALRALRYMFYGIPERSTDNFIHPYSKIRIGASIRSENGDVFEFIRRKGRGKTLRAADDLSMLEEGDLQRFLRGVDADFFATMFGIDYGDLVRGGREIVQGGGELGRLIFSAGSGIVNLSEVQNELQTAADALFRPSGRKQKINEALGLLNNKRNEMREAQLPGQDWEKHDKALRAALERKDVIEKDLIKQQKELNKLKRVHEAFPLIADRRELMSELKEYATAVLLPEEFPEKRRELLTKMGIAEKEITQAQKAIESHKQAISELRISPVLMEHSDLIEEIYRELGRERKASKDRIALGTRRNSLRGEAKEILFNLRDDLTLGEAERLRIRKSETVKIQELGARYERITTRIEDAKEKLPGLTQEILQLGEESNTLAVPRAVEDLNLAMAEAIEFGPLERQNRIEEEEIRSSLKTIELEQNRLGLGKKSLEGLEILPAPSLETIRMVEGRLDITLRRLADINGEIKRVKKTLLEVERRIKMGRLEQEVPTEEDLRKIRELRDRGWRLISRKLKEEPILEEELQNYLREAAKEESLAGSFEANLKQADFVSDRLRREADRVAAKARLIADQTTFNEQLKNLNEDLITAEKERKEIIDDWENLWLPLGIPPQLPKEMGLWAQAFHALLEKVKVIRDLISKADSLKQEIDAQRLKLEKCLHSFPEQQIPKDEPLTLLIKRAQTIIDNEKELSRKREQLAREKSLKEKEFAAAGSILEANELKLAEWQTQWEEAVRPIGLEADSLPAQATAVMEELKGLFDKLKEAEILQKRIDGIDCDSDKFIRKIRDLAKIVAMDLTVRSADEAALDLHNRLKRSREASTKKEALEKQLQLEQERLKQATDDISQVETEMRGMCVEAGCDQYNDLQEAENRSGKRRQIEADLKAVNERLRQLSGGDIVDDFISKALLLEPDGIPGEIELLEVAIGDLHRERSGLDRTIGSEQTELSKMDGSARAAELAEEIQILLGGLENDVEQYARFKIAAKVLSRAIERYREKSEGPILIRASSLFNQITDGAFEGIRAEFDPNGAPIMVGVKSSDGEIVNVEGMSDGTADQLFLALRLAGLEMYLENNEPIPFIVDDILIKFDNDRAAAALQALAKISEKTQLIFFTHHKHLLDLAREKVDLSILFEHTLGV